MSGFTTVTDRTSPSNEAPAGATLLSAAPARPLADDSTKASRVSEILASLGHPTRLRIVAVLAEGEEHVTGLSERLGISQPHISQQLSILRMRGLVEVVRAGGFAFYHLAEPRLRNVISCMEQCRKP